MITIHYSGYYDEGYFLVDLAEKQPGYNVLYMGPVGLLGFLEQIFGLSGNYSDQHERINLYSLALSKHLALETDAFYGQAFSNNEMGVAKDLIGWRDELILSGWKDINSNEQPPRLRSLLHVEQHFVEKHYHFGIADRWQNILKALSTHVITDDFRILVYDDIELIHPFFGKLFNILHDKVEFKSLTDGITMPDNNLGRIKNILLSKSVKKVDSSPLEKDNSFAILYLKDNHQASDILAHVIKKGYCPLVISSDNKVLDHYLVSNGIPASGSKLEDSNPLIIQLFKLVAVGLTGPLNVYNLLSFLQSPYLPVPKRLASKLAALLIEKSGVGNEDWKAAIEDHFTEMEKAEGADLARINKKRQESLLFLSFNHQNSVDLEHAAEVYSVLYGWAQKNAAVDEFGHSDEEKEQFAYLSKLAEIFLQKLRSLSGSIDSGHFLRLVESIYEPATFTNYKCQAASVRHVKSPSMLLGNPDKVWWNDCYNAGLKNYGSSFFLSSEMDFLEKNGIPIHSSEKQVKLAYLKEKLAILKAKEQCVLVCVEKHNGEGITGHPVISEIRSWINDPENLMATTDQLILLTGILPQTELSIRSTLPEEQAYINITKPENLSKRELESASSIEKLIHHPFEWSVNYQAGLKSTNSFTLPEIFTQKGTVAHSTTQHILSEKKQSELSGLSNEYIKTILERKILEEGLVFLLPENKFEYEDLIRKYIFAFRSLVHIITENDLIIIGPEILKQDTIEGIGNVEGKMDLLLKARDGIEIIFDLKWTRRNTKYRTRIEKGKDIQLAVYSGLTGNNPKTAYFMFDTGMLISRHAFTGTNVIAVDGGNMKTEEEVLQMAVNSFKYRWAELAQGKIEIGDGCDVENLDYFRDMEVNNLIPLDMDEKKNKKYGDLFSGLELFKGTIK